MRRTKEHPPLSSATLARLDPFRAILGTRPDGEIASSAGVDRRYVVIFRNTLGIAPFDFHNAVRESSRATPTGPKHFRRSKLDAFLVHMGNLTDGEVAQMAGSSREAVMRYRQRHGIAAVTQRVNPPAPTPEWAAPEMPGNPPEDADKPTPGGTEKAAHSEVLGFGLSQAFVVTMETSNGTRRFVAVGADIVHAASRAMGLMARMDGARIVSIEHFGDALSG